MNIIITENSKIIRERLASMLSMIEGLEVKQYDNLSLSQSKKILNSQPDVFIIGIEMSLSECTETLKLIKEITPNTRIIILANYPYQQIKDKCEDLGNIHFFDKFTEAKKIIDVCKNLLAMQTKN